MSDVHDSTWPYLPIKIPVPEIFHSLADGPFRRCIECEGALLVEDSRYFIQRCFQGDEPILEYAVCQDCTQAMHGKMSRESRQRIESFTREHIDYHGRIEELIDHVAAGSVERWIERCLITGDIRQDCRQKNLCARCEGDQLLLGVWPYFVSGKAVEQINEMLSEQTRGWMNDFIGEHFGMPPEFCDSPNDLPLLL